jgi:hypothetical protein
MGDPNCREPLVFEQTLHNERYATGSHQDTPQAMLYRTYKLSPLARERCKY